MTTDPQTDRPRAIHFLEAADFLRDAHFRDGLSVQEIGAALRHMADEADPMVGSLARDGFGLDEIAAMPVAPSAAVSPPPATDRAGLSAKLWEIAEHHIVAEWICCEPLEPGHRLCAKGYAALGMAKSLLVDSDPEKAWNPEAPLLNAVLAELEQLRRERDLAIAHDRQPYPTAWAYEQACKALRRKTETIERVQEWVTSEAVTAKTEFGDGYRASQRDIRDLLKGRFDNDAANELRRLAAGERDEQQTQQDGAETLPPPEGPEYIPCACGHIEPEHRRQRPGWTREACCKCPCVDYAPVVQQPDPPETAEEPSPEKTVRGHVLALHQIGEQLAGIESWMWEHLADTRDAAAPVAGQPPADTGEEAREASGVTPCGPVPDQCDPDDGPCERHEREQSHADNDHSVCRRDECSVLRQS